MKIVDIPTLDDYLEDSNNIININDYKGLEPNEIPAKYIGKFILAGDALITVVNKESKGGFTYMITKQKEYPNRDNFIWFVSVCTPSMEFNYLGVLVTNTDDSYNFNVSRKIINNPIATQSFEYVVKNYINKFNPNKKVHFYHSGKCVCCDKILITEQSMLLGICSSCVKLI